MTHFYNESLFMLVLFFANVVQTITGFAGNLLAMPISIKLVGHETSAAVINIFTMIACALITYKNKEHLKIIILMKIIVFMLIGMAVGIRVFERVGLDLLLKIYGVMIVWIAVNRLYLKKSFRIPDNFQPLIIIMAGVIHGIFLSGGALLVVYATTVLKDKDSFRATIAPVWVILDFMLIFTHYRLGYYTQLNVMLIILSMFPLALSFYIGNRIYHRIDQALFLKITYMLLFISGIVAII